MSSESDWGMDGFFDMKFELSTRGHGKRFPQPPIKSTNRVNYFVAASSGFETGGSVTVVPGAVSSEVSDVDVVEFFVSVVPEAVSVAVAKVNVSLEMSDVREAVDEEMPSTSSGVNSFPFLSLMWGWPSLSFSILKPLSLFFFRNSGKAFWTFSATSLPGGWGRKAWRGTMCPSLSFTMVRPSWSFSEVNPSPLCCLRKAEINFSMTSFGGDGWPKEKSSGGMGTMFPFLSFAIGPFVPASMVKPFFWAKSFSLLSISFKTSGGGALTDSDAVEVEDAVVAEESVAIKESVADEVVVSPKTIERQKVKNTGMKKRFMLISPLMKKWNYTVST